MAFIQKLNPAGAIGDFVSVWRAGGRSRYVILLLACVPALSLVVMFYNDLKVKSAPPPPEVIYVESWSEDRSMAEVMSDRAERAKREAAADAARRERYKALGRAVGMDVDAIEAEAEAARAAERREAADEPDAGTADAATDANADD